MKKLLLGTTTLVGMAVAASAALADTPKITVGGTSDFQLGVASDDGDANMRNHAFRADNELSFKVDGKTDAGLGYGGQIWLEADTTDDADTQGTNASKTFVYLDGGWGRFEGGSTTGTAVALKVGAESIARATGGIDGDWTYFATNPGTTLYLATPDLMLDYGNRTLGYGDESLENVNKINYFTPRIAGFQAGISYQPDMEIRGQNVTAATRADNTANQADGIVQGGINYEGKFSNIGFAAAVTGEWGDAETAATEDLRTWNAGAKASYMGFSLAGSYGNWGDSLQTKASNADDSRYWTAGAAYETGPFAASVTYLNSQYSIINTGANSDNDFKNIVIGADYKLAPGLTPYAELSIYDADANGTANDNDGHVFLLGTQLNF